MSWNSVHGHGDQVERIRHALERGRMATALLFVGKQGIGKRRFATELAKSVLCDHNDERQFSACGSCESCQQIDASTHPDLLVVEKPADKAFIPVESFIGDREHRMREGLCHDIQLKPFSGGRKIAVIDDADFLNEEGANCLLKTLEEPPPQSIIILIGTSAQRQLPTIRSRVQTIRFDPLPANDVKQILVEQDLLSDSADAERLSLASGGSVRTAIDLSEPDVWEFRQSWFEHLASRDPGGDDFAKVFGRFVDAAGSESAAKRARLRMAADWAVDFFHAVMVKEPDADPVLQQAMSQWDAHTSPGSADAAADCAERCIDVRQQIAANANQTTLIETWLAELGRLSRRETTVLSTGQSY